MEEYIDCMVISPRFDDLMPYYRQPPDSQEVKLLKQLIKKLDYLIELQHEVEENAIYTPSPSPNT